MKLIAINSQADTLGLQPWWYARNALVGSDNVALLVVLTCLALGAAFLWLPRRWAPLLSAVVALGFLFTWLPLELWQHSFRRAAIGAYFQGLKSQQRDWIDRTVGRDANVAALWTDRGNPFTIWENEFWNRSVRRVYDLGSPLPGGMPETKLMIDRATGVMHDARGRPLDARYVLTDTTVSLVGTVLREDVPRGMVLYRVAQPARSTTRIIGLYDDGWSQGSTVEWSRAACRGGTLTVHERSDPTLFSGRPQTLTVRTTGLERSYSLPPAEERDLTIPLRPSGGTCEVIFTITPTAKPSVVEHTHDTRLLGLRLEHFVYRAKP